MTPTNDTTNGIAPATPVNTAMADAIAKAQPKAAKAAASPRDPGKAPDGTPRPTGLDYRTLTQKLGFDSGEVLNLKNMGLSWEDIFDSQHQAVKPVVVPVASQPKSAPAYVPQGSETMAQELARLRVENAAAKAALAARGTVGKISMKVSEPILDKETGEMTKAGNMVIYGLSGRRPITLYKSAAAYLFGNPTVSGDMGHGTEIRAWLKANWNSLRDKD
jgi:hypothetical protein